jgi:hypothetical protein
MSIYRSLRKYFPSALRQMAPAGTPILSAADIFRSGSTQRQNSASCRYRDRFRRRNQHISTADLLGTFPRFPPLGRVRRLRSKLTGYGMLSHKGQESDKPQQESFFDKQGKNIDSRHWSKDEMRSQLVLIL